MAVIAWVVLLPPSGPPRSVRAAYSESLLPWPVYRIGMPLLEFADRFAREMTPPEMRVPMLAGVWMESVIVYAVAKLSICDVMWSMRQPSSVDEVAQGLVDRGVVTSIQTGHLQRLMDAAIEVGLFAKQGDKYVLTPSGEMLRADHPRSSRATVLFLAGPDGMAPWHAVVNSVQTGNSGWMEVYGKEKFQHMLEEPAQWHTFDRAQAAMSKLLQHSLLAEYAFTGRINRTGSDADFVFCDIGGGEGVIMAEVLSHYPNARGLLLDQSAPVVAANNRFAAKSLADRAMAIEGSFFDPLPQEFQACDYFHLRWILHDWSDHDSHRILSRVAEAAERGAAVLLSEAVLGTQPHIFERHKRLMDLTMMAWHQPGAKERTLSEFDSLLSSLGYKRAAYVESQGPMAVMEYRRPHTHGRPEHHGAS
ncbi:unnamed protein product [Vitrella brassicaformis CCMP3155]|uniref:Uncharacterized protein n=2 Tax=Vitrella brassicaformis TaxID=1169539 RepID=A0A0G4GH01_VITBC|nr:unnamed protein product [Vitrella brassicaformis CCMP3155]|eukprot:CEM28915.1 unnamed protein product [Vitrella brassicaformis CCMP3155]